MKIVTHMTDQNFHQWYNKLSTLVCNANQLFQSSDILINIASASAFCSITTALRKMPQTSPEEIETNYSYFVYPFIWNLNKENLNCKSRTPLTLYEKHIELGVFVLTKKNNLGKIVVDFFSANKALEILKPCLPKNTNRPLKSRKNLREK